MDISKEDPAYQLGWAIGTLKMIAGQYPPSREKPHCKMTAKELAEIAQKALRDLGEE